jgi:hypothetical protein
MSRDRQGDPSRDMTRGAKPEIGAPRSRCATRATVCSDQLRSEYFKPRELDAPATAETKPFKQRPCNPGFERSHPGFRHLPLYKMGWVRGTHLTGHDSQQARPGRRATIITARLLLSPMMLRGRFRVYGVPGHANPTEPRGRRRGRRALLSCLAPNCKLHPLSQVANQTIDEAH